MHRREFMRLLGGATVASSPVWPINAGAQQSAVPVIGYLRSGTAAGFLNELAAFRRGLESMGYVEGRNVAFEYRYADNQYDRLSALAADLLRRQVALIYAGDNAAAVSAKAASTMIPIVF